MHVKQTKVQMFQFPKGKVRLAELDLNNKTFELRFNSPRVRCDYTRSRAKAIKIGRFQFPKGKVRPTIQSPAQSKPNEMFQFPKGKVRQSAMVKTMMQDAGYRFQFPKGKVRRE